MNETSHGHEAIIGSTGDKRCDPMTIDYKQAHLLNYRLNMNYWPIHDIAVLNASASSEGSGKSAHMHRLVRSFPASIHKAWL